VAILLTPSFSACQSYTNNGSAIAQLNNEPPSTGAPGLRGLTAEEALELRRQVVELKVKNNMLRQELEVTIQHSLLQLMYTF
jgi:hypothetical protein